MIVFLTEVDRTGFFGSYFLGTGYYLFGYYFLIYFTYYCLACALPVFTVAFGGALFGGIIVAGFCAGTGFVGAVYYFCF